MDHKSKSQWESSNFIYDKDYGYDGFSWRQRNFMCNFCKKEYKSAQALGGHMNVHRRDRARLRLSSPPLDQPNPNSNPNQNPNQNPNPNPNFTSPPTPLGCLPYKTFHSSLFTLSSPSLTMNIEEKQELFPFVPHFARNFLGDIRNNMMSMEEGCVENGNEGFNGNFVTQENESMVWNKSGVLRVEMETDLLKDGKNETGLDLELRLGRS